MITGRVNTRVLPEPVNAMPIISLPESLWEKERSKWGYPSRLHRRRGIHYSTASSIGSLKGKKVGYNSTCTFQGVRPTEHYRTYFWVDLDRIEWSWNAGCSNTQRTWAFVFLTFAALRKAWRSMSNLEIQDQGGVSSSLREYLFFKGYRLSLTLRKLCFNPKNSGRTAVLKLWGSFTPSLSLCRRRASALTQSLGLCPWGEWEGNFVTYQRCCQGLGVWGALGAPCSTCRALQCLKTAKVPAAV